MYNPAKLNVAQKTRSNPFSWRGQFTPELIEYFLDTDAAPGDAIGDPFSGSGTVLLESLARGLDVVGCEVNPAAYAMSKFFEIAACDADYKRQLCDTLYHSIPQADWDYWASKPVYQKKQAPSYRQEYTHLIHFAEQLIQKCCSKYELVLILNMFFKMEGYKRLTILSAWHKAYEEVTCFLYSLPEAKSAVSALLADARDIHAHTPRKLDLIITSPPYINVFNYHQNHRMIVELLNFDILSVAHSEFGSNRKHRGNRFYTVVQYCLDMGQALVAMRKSLSDKGKVILIIGRESNVRKTPFYNGKIVQDLCLAADLFYVADVSQRFFQNKFGVTIYEDILTLKPGKIESIAKHTDECARTVAMSHLQNARNEVHSESKPDLENAISAVNSILPSPRYFYRGIIVCPFNRP